MQTKLGLVQVYTGDGKGKTTASLGQGLRAIGHHYRIFMIQFLKTGLSGEVAYANNHLINFRIEAYGAKCVNDKMHRKDFAAGKFKGCCKKCFDTNKENKPAAERGFQRAYEVATSGNWDIVILDEVNVVMNMGLIPVESVLRLIKNKHPTTELVLTGRNAPEEVIKAADLVSEVRRVKHYFDKGVPARMGTEF